jgi:hypothetical protein
MPSQSNVNLALYYAAHSDPQAVVILNRGDGAHELDVTDWVTGFNTTNSIESITGSFTVTLDNTNDYWIDRFNFSKIKKMSSIEIFVKPPQAFNSNKGQSSQTLEDVNDKTNATSVKVPDGIKTLEDFVKQLYGADNPDKGTLKKRIEELNKTGRFTTVPSYSMLIQGLYQKGITYTIGSKATPVASSRTTTNPSFIEFEFTASGDNSLTYLKLQINRPKTWDAEKPLITEKDGFLEFPSGDIFAIKKDGTKTGLPQNLKQFCASKFINVDITLLKPNSDEFEPAAIEEAILVPMPSDTFQRIFFGIVTTISSSTSPASNMTVTISGKGLGYWLESSVINQSPAGFEVSLTGQDLTGFATRLAEKKALDIFKELISVGLGNIPATMALNASNGSTNLETLKLLGDNPLNGNSEPAGAALSDLYGGSMDATDPDTGEKLKGIAIAYPNNASTSEKLAFIENKLKLAYYGHSPTNTKNYNANIPSSVPPASTITAGGDTNWRTLGNTYGQAQKDIASARVSIQNLTGRKNSTADAADKQYLQKQIEGKENGIKELEKKASNAKAAMDTPGCASYKQIRGLEVSKANLTAKVATKTLPAGRNQFFNTFGIIEHWRKIFSNIILEVMDDDPFLNSIYPFNLSIKGPSADLDGDYATKAQIGRQIAEYMQYEFYFDSNGHFVLKPPLYNISHRLMGDLYEIEDVDVISFSMNDTAEGIITRIGVTGDFREAPGANALITKNIFQDMYLIRDYGWIQRDIANLYFVKTPIDAREFGKSYMSRNNMNLFNGSITIHGRPQIRIGTSLYFKPRDTVFYIREISHEFTAGNGYQTTISVTGGRRILVGFKSSLNVTKISYVVKEGIISLEPGKNKETISHFIQARGLDADTIIMNNFVPIDAQDKIEENAVVAREVGAFPDAPKKLYILKNKYMVTSHPNPAFIGLIVEKQDASGVIAKINIANYDYFNRLTKDNIPSVYINTLAPQPADRDKIANKIRNYFKEYIIALQILPEDFDMDQRDLFITDFLTSIQQVVSGNITSDTTNYEEQIASIKAELEDSPSSREQLKQRISQLESAATFSASKDNLNKIINDGKDPASVNQKTKEQLKTLAQVFNSLVNYVDGNGIYRQYTDAEGREIPAYQNYGLGYGISDKVSKINNAIETGKLLKNTEANRKALAENVKARVRDLSGVYNPDSAQYKAIMSKAFLSYAKEIALNSQAKTAKDNQPAKPSQPSQLNPNDQSTPNKPRPN